MKLNSPMMFSSRGFILQSATLPATLRLSPSRRPFASRPADMKESDAFINPAITVILRMGAGGHGVPPLGSPDDLMTQNDTALHIALKYDKLEAFKFLVGWLVKDRSYWSKILNQKNVESITILHIVVSKNQTPGVNEASSLFF
uniref:Uncharacterized protein n=1 Tax=Quercus lobata TaxID=97700 RepID=A0A7N2KLH1_QUELO